MQFQYIEESHVLLDFVYQYLANLAKFGILCDIYMMSV